MSEETNEQYHSDRSHVSASMLKDLNNSPRVFEAKHVTQTMRSEPTANMELGTAVHCAVLEPQRFATQYITQPAECNDRRTKAYKQWAETVHPSQIVLKIETAQTVQRCAEALRSQPIVRMILEANGRVEVSHRWTCGLTSVPCKFRPDKVCPDAHQRIIFDIKTIADLSDGKFAFACRDFGYDIQAAHYLAGTASMFGGELDDWQMVFGVVETSEPFRCRAYTLNYEDVCCGRDDRERLLNDYRRRTESGDWSELDEDSLTTISIPRRRQYA